MADTARKIIFRAHNERRWIPPCRARTGLQASAVLRACSMLHETPATPFAGSEWGIRIACDPPTQQSSHAGDDGGKFTVALKTTVNLAQAHYRHPGKSRDPVSLFAYHRLESPTDQLPISDADPRQDIRTRITRSCTQCVFNSQQLNPLHHALRDEFIDFQ